MIADISKRLRERADCLKKNLDDNGIVYATKYDIMDMSNACNMLDQYKEKVATKRHEHTPIQQWFRGDEMKKKTVYVVAGDYLIYGPFKTAESAFKWISEQGFGFRANVRELKQP